MSCRVLICSLALVLVAAAAGRAAPVDGEVRPFTIESTRRAVGVSSENHWIVQGPAGSGQPPAASGLYRETLDLGFIGSVYHPNLMSYSLDALLGLSQQAGLSRPEEAAGEGQALQHSLIADLHLHTRWLQEKPLSFSLHADRSDGFHDIGTFEEARVKETALGGLLSWQNAALPLTLSVEKRVRDEARDAQALFEDSLVLAGGMSRTSADERIASRLDYAFSDFDRRVGDAFRQVGRSHDARFFNSLRFGRSEGSQLSSSLYYLNLRGTEDTDTFDLAETLELRHPWGLSSRAFYGLHVTGLGSSRVVSQQGELQLRHQLYESLTSSMSLRGGLTRAADYRESGIGPGLDLLYRKKTSFGWLNLDYGVDADWRSRQADAGTIRISDERLTLSDGTVTFLHNAGADPATIVITDAAGTTVYVPGVDYTATQVDGRIQLRRLAGGGIPNGAQVLVDYVTATDPSSGYVALAQAAGLRLDLPGERLALYYRLRSEQIPGAAGGGQAALERVLNHTFGASLNLQPLSGSAEYEHHGSSLSPYQALRFQENLSLPIADRALLAVQGSQNLVWFHGRRRAAGLPGPVRPIRLPPWSSAVLYTGGGFRLQSGTGADLQSMWLARAGLDFKQGLLAFSVEYELKGSNSAGDGQWNHALSAWLKREF